MIGQIDPKDSQNYLCSKGLIKLVKNKHLGGYDKGKVTIYKAFVQITLMIKNLTSHEHGMVNGFLILIRNNQLINHISKCLLHLLRRFQLKK